MPATTATPEATSATLLATCPTFRNAPLAVDVTFRATERPPAFDLRLAAEAVRPLDLVFLLFATAEVRRAVAPRFFVEALERFVFDALRREGADLLALRAFLDALRAAMFCLP